MSDQGSKSENVPDNPVAEEEWQEFMGMHIVGSVASETPMAQRPQMCDMPHRSIRFSSSGHRQYNSPTIHEFDEGKHCKIILSPQGDHPVYILFPDIRLNKRNLTITRTFW